MFSWLIIFVLTVNIFRLIDGETLNINTNNASETVAPEENMYLKRCCKENLNKSDSCNVDSHFPVNWNILQFYRIPKINTSWVSSANATIDGDSVNPRLNCDNVVSLRIPFWKESETSHFGKGSFAAFHQDGYLKYDKFEVPPEEYCVERMSPTELSLVACNYSSYCSNPSQDLSEISCISRCCDYGEVWDLSGGKFRCASSGQLKWKPNLFSDLYEESNCNGDTSSRPLVISTHPRDMIRTTCTTSVSTFHSAHPSIRNHDELRKKFGKSPFRILKNGTAWIKLRKHEWAQLTPGEYCIDGFQFGEGTFSGKSEDVLLFECKLFESSDEVEEKQIQRNLSLCFGIILVFCLVFLIITALVYVMLWSKHNIHGWTVFCYILSLLVTYFLLGASHLSSISLVRKGHNEESKGKVGMITVCGIIGVLCHFSFLSTFSWSTVLNFDLWCTFRNLRPAHGNSGGRKKFFFYCLFALATPMLIVGIGIYLDLTYREDVFNDVITPEYGRAVCYVDPRYARFYFIIVPIAVLLGVNLILFCNTAYSLYKVKKSTQFASSSSTRSKAGNETFRLILKLLLVNGTIWIAEIISWYLQADYDRIGTISFILDVTGILQSVAIFFIFVMKNDILNALKRSYPSLEGVVNFAYKLKQLCKCQRSSQAVASAASSTTRTSYVNENNTRVTKV